MFGTVPPILLGYHRNLMTSVDVSFQSLLQQTLRPVRTYESRNPFWSRPLLCHLYQQN